ncbi:MAG: helix-turn-helix transcriptional regulator [Lachnospiraceae bacterium]|nr:helix-turn-helix transcriptional regulator [Lachnospiraceae bacterium]
MENFVRNRITQLRLNKGISEYQLSYDLGHSRGYINNISSGKSLPSLSEFFYICDYFDITPKEFFDTEHKTPELVSKAISEINKLDDDDILLVLTLISRINKAK